MAKKRRKRRSAIRRSKIEEPISKKEERKKFPKKLIEAYLAVRDNWENDELYLKYQEETKKYLGDKWGDRLEDSRLVVLLHVVTADLHNGKKEKNKKEADKNKKLGSNRSVV